MAFALAHLTGRRPTALATAVVLLAVAARGLASGGAHSNVSSKHGFMKASSKAEKAFILPAQGQYSIQISGCTSLPLAPSMLLELACNSPPQSLSAGNA